MTQTRARLSGRHRRFLLVEQGLVPGLINLFLAVVFTLVVFRKVAELPLWGRSSVGVDLLTTAVCLPFFTSLINSAMISRDVRRGKVLPLPVGLQPTGSWHLTSVVTRTLVLTVGVVVFAALPVLVVLELTHTRAMDLHSYVELKAVWATLMALAIAPFIGWWALAQASAGLPAQVTGRSARADRIVCTPLDLSNRYHDMTVGPFFPSAAREAADPSLRFQGRY